MSDDKRYYRELKQQVKRTGNKKLRRFLKDPTADPADFDYGNSESSAFNGKDGKNRKRKGKKPNRDDK